MTLEDVYAFICAFVGVEDKKMSGPLMLSKESYIDDERVTERLKALGYLE